MVEEATVVVMEVEVTEEGMVVVEMEETTRRGLKT